MSRQKRKPRVRVAPAVQRPEPRLFMLAIGSGLVMIALVLLHTPYVNGPWYWHWGWQRLRVWHAYPGVLIASLPFLFAQFLHERWPARQTFALALLMVTTLMLELNTIVMASGTFSTERLWRIVEDVRATSYFTDAVQSYRLMPTLKSWFVAFPEILPRLHIHSQNKPPGLMLFYMFFVAHFPVDDHQAAVVAGLAIGVLATLAIPAVFFLIRALGGSETSAFLGASAMTLCPGFIVFFPEFDQIYASVGAVLVGCWMLSLRRGSRGWAFACGAALCVACFLAFNLLVLGLFMGAASIYLAIRRECTFSRIVQNGAIVLACVVACYVSLQLILGYDIVATFQSSLTNQAELIANMVRPYPQTILFDLTDYALGLGWMSAVLLVMSARERNHDPGEPHARGFVWIIIGQLLVLAICALLAVETARVWIFLFPLAMYAVGRELSRWSFRQRLVFFGVAFLSLAAIGQNMIFFSLTPTL